MESNWPEKTDEKRSRRLAILFFVLVPVVIIAGIMAVRYSTAQKETAKFGSTESSDSDVAKASSGSNRKIDLESVIIPDKVTENISGKVTEKVPENNAVWTELPEDAAFDPEAPPYVTELFEGYFKAKLSGDAVLADSYFYGGGPKGREEEERKLLKSLEYIEDYRDLVCYTIQGPVEHSLVVYVSYKIKFHQSEIPAPSLSVAFVKMNEDGIWRIYEGDMEDRLRDYMDRAGQLDCAKELARQVQEAFVRAIAEDGQLAEIYAIAVAATNPQGTAGQENGAKSADSPNESAESGSWP